MTSVSFSHSPYRLSRTRIGYEFFTDLGEHYALYFSDASGYFEGTEFAPHALMLGLQRLTEGERNSPHDPRIAVTLSSYAEKAFDDNRTIIVYVCDQTDSLEQQRHRLFNRLFTRYSSGRFVKHVLAENDTLYASLFYSRANPYSRQIENHVPEVREKFRPDL